jgi:hypothetical protein
MTITLQEAKERVYISVLWREIGYKCQQRKGRIAGRRVNCGIEL